MPGALAGYRVLDLTSVLSGPLATRLLADQGADVIKIEHPGGGDFSRQFAKRRGGLSALFLNNNRNKRSVAIDLKHPDGAGVFLRLAANADVVVQNFRPGVADRLGLGEAAVRTAAPDVIHASITGFGSAGPLSDKPVFDPLVQALSGLATVQAGSDKVRPLLVRTFLADKLTAMEASQAITAALLLRERTGKGQTLEVSMLDVMISFLWSSDMDDHTFVDDPAGMEHAEPTADMIYETADGYISVSAMRDKEWAKLAIATGNRNWVEDPRFRTAELREENREERLALMQSILRTEGTEHWVRLFEAHDVPYAPVLTRREMIAHPQVAANETLYEITHPQVGRIRQARSAPRFSATPSKTHWRFAPRLGEHSRDVLQDAGYAPEEIESLRSAGVIGTSA